MSNRMKIQYKSQKISENSKESIYDTTYKLTEMLSSFVIDVVLKNTQTCTFISTKGRYMEKKFETRNTVTEGNMGKRIVVVIFGFIEVLLGFRFVFKLMGANPGNVFVKGMYDVTQMFVGIFQGIFSTSTTTGAETKAVFEPGTLIAIVVVALIAWFILKLMSQNSSSQVKRTEVSDNNIDHLN